MTGSGGGFSLPKFGRKKSTFFASHPSAANARQNSTNITEIPIEKLKLPLYIDSRKLQGIHQFIQSNDLRRLKSHLQASTQDINKLDDIHRLSPIHMAVNSNNYDAVDVLLTEGADTDVLDKNGRTSLILAAIRGYSDIAQLLLKYNANKDVQGALGCTALHYSVILGDISCFKLLMDAKANISLIDKSELPLFYHAIRSKRGDIANQLIADQSPAQINAFYGSTQTTALHVAVEHSLSSTIYKLVQAGADLNALDSKKRKPVDCIDYDKCHPDTIAFLNAKEKESEDAARTNTNTINCSNSISRPEPPIIHDRTLENTDISKSSATLTDLTGQLDSSSPAVTKQSQQTSNQDDTKESISISKEEVYKQEVERLQAQLFLAITAKAEADVQNSEQFQELDTLKREVKAKHKEITVLKSQKIELEALLKAELERSRLLEARGGIGDGNQKTTSVELEQVLIVTQEELR
ncbi:ankyrin repeat-containing domain protein, partial [Obelidium mucronatum]